MEATVGGTRRHLIDVARGQRQAGLDVHVAASTLREPGMAADLARLADEGVGVLALPMVRAVRPLSDRRHARALAEHLAAVRPDVVHTHSSKAGALGRWASLRTGIGRRVHTPHAFAFRFAALFSPARRRLYRAIETYLGRRTDRVIAVSAEEGETIRASGVCDPERVRVVPNGIDPRPYGGATAATRARVRAALGVPDGAPLALVVGLLYEAKGQDLALRAMAAPGLEQLVVAFAGDGEGRAEYEALARELALGRRARFLGWRDDVPDLLAAADLLLLPSRWEGMPYAVLEAFAAGLPVVAARVDGTRALVVDGCTGFTAPVDDARALAAATARLLALAPESRRALGAAGRARATADFSLEAMVRGLVRVYEEVV
jgi:glycosyltransferase involved in cell wall biosynthesis